MNTPQKSAAKRATRKPAPRFQEKLTFMMSVAPGASNGAPETTAAAATRPFTLVGHTRNISASGLALIVPSIRFGNRYLTARRASFWITVEQAGRRLAMEVAPIRYEWLEEEADGAAGAGYLLAAGDNLALAPDGKDVACLLGVAIVKMSKGDRAAYRDYLKRLNKKNDSSGAATNAEMN